MKTRNKIVSTNNLYKIIVVLLTGFLPGYMWYKGAYSVAGLLSRWTTVKQTTKYRDTIKINHATKLNRLLDLMTQIGKKSFLIPVRVHGLSVFDKTRPNGLILCSTHLPLSKVGVCFLAEQNLTPGLVAIAAEPGITNSIALWGSTKRLAAIPVDQFVLHKARTVLQRGETVVVMADQYLGGLYSPNIFRLAEKLRSDIVFSTTLLHQDKTIEVTFYESKWNGQSDRVQEQMTELHQHTSVLLQQYDNSGYLIPPC